MKSKISGNYVKFDWLIFFVAPAERIPQSYVAETTGAIVENGSSVARSPSKQPLAVALWAGVPVRNNGNRNIYKILLKLTKKL